MERYYNLEKIASGTSSIVYKAIDSSTGKTVAIKEFIYQDPNQDENAVSYLEQFRRYKREIEIHLSLEHKNIIKALNYFEKDSKLYLVMEYITEKTLHDFIENNNNLSLFDTINIVKQLAIALQYIHDNGIIHRDIKPNNILVDENKNVYIIDFGCAKRIFSDNITTSRIMVGTLNYMSPEQIIGHSEIDGRTDIFALGCTFYQLISNKLPFKGKNIKETIHNILHSNPIPLKNLNNNIPFKLEVIVHQTLSKDPEKRCPTANLLINYLNKILEEPEIYYIQGKYYQENKNLVEAFNLYKKALEKDETYIPAWKSLAEIYFDANNLDKALEYYNFLVKIDSSNNELYSRLGEIYYLKNDFPKSFENYQKAWVLNPIVEYEISMANCVFSSGKVNESIELFHSIIDRNKNNIKPKYSLGILYYKLKNYDKALEIFKECLNIDNSNYDVLLSMASLYQEIGKLDEAIDIYLKLEAVNSNDNIVLQNLACAYYQKGELDKSEEKINYLINKGFKSYKLLYLLAFIYKSREENEKALDIYNKVLEDYPNDIYTYINISDVYRSKWDISASINILNKALSLDSKESKSIIHFKLAQLYKEKGLFQEAEKHYTEFLSRSTKNSLYNIAKQELKNLMRYKKYNKIINFRKIING
jgi:serine/threonine protein kinase